MLFNDSSKYVVAQLLVAAAQQEAENYLKSAHYAAGLILAHQTEARGPQPTSPGSLFAPEGPLFNSPDFWRGWLSIAAHTFTHTVDRLRIQFRKPFLPVPGAPIFGRAFLEFDLFLQDHRVIDSGLRRLETGARAIAIFRCLYGESLDLSVGLNEQLAEFKANLPDIAE